MLEGNNDLVGGTKEPKMSRIMRKLPISARCCWIERSVRPRPLRRFEGPDVFKEVPSSWKWGPFLSDVLLAAVDGESGLNGGGTRRFQAFEKAVSTNQTGDYPFRRRPPRQRAG